MNEAMVREVLQALIDSGLWVFDAGLIGPGNPASMPDFEYIIGLMKKSPFVEISDDDVERTNNVCKP